MNLEVILLEKCLPMERCLRQIGTPYRVLDPNTSPPEESAVYFSAIDTVRSRDRIKKLLEKKRHVVIPQSHLRYWSDANPCLSTFSDSLLNWREKATLKTFAVGECHPKERVAVQSTHAAVKFFQKLLSGIFEKQGVFFPAISPYPFGYRTIFSCRIDADEYNETICATFFEKLKPHHKGTSVFFSAANFYDHPNLLRDCATAGLEVLSHSFHHFTYRSFPQNACNIRKAVDFFQKLDFLPTGFAAPHGRWNQGLQTALEKSSYRFSSDFAYDYDSFPSFPFGSGGFSKVLQIPIHPVCSGICLESSEKPITHRDLTGYFETIFKNKYEAAEPIIFYEHPTAWTVQNFSLIDRWFAFAKEFPDVWTCHMGEFADWWHQRDQLSIKVTQEPHTSRIDVRCTDSSRTQNVFALNLYRGSDRAFTQLQLNESQMTADLTNASFVRQNATGTTVAEIPGCGYDTLQHCIKKSLQEFLDWETVTPVDEIIVHDVGTLCKKIARTVATKPRRMITKEH